MKQVDCVTEKNAAKTNTRVGHIFYANSLPIYEAIFNRRVSIDGQIVSTHPAELNHKILNDELDISPVSSVIYAKNQDKLKLMNGLCINSLGTVYSVLLASNTPIERWNGETIGLTQKSATSAILVRILLEQYYQFTCNYRDVPFSKCGQLEGVIAELIIGDAAFLNKNQFKYHYDLADLWLKLTGKAIVFAVWVVRSQFAKENPEKVRSIERSLLESYHKVDRQQVLQKAKEQLNISERELELYFTALGYNFDASMQHSLLDFYEKAAKMRLVPSCLKLSFWDQN